MEKASEHDIAELVEIRAAVRENILSDPAKVPESAYRWFINEAAIWIWREQGRILGFAAADPRDASIWALFLRPEEEGRGIGSALLSQLLDELRQAGWHQATLWTDSNSRAATFYQNRGWQPIKVAEGETQLRCHL